MDLPTVLDDLQRSRRQLLLGLAGTAAVGLGTLVLPPLGAIGASVATAGSPLGGPLFPGLAGETVSVGVIVGGVLASLPLAGVLLGGSLFWHRRVARALRQQGIDDPALGILAPARLVAAPGLIGAAVLALVLPLVWLMPTPDTDDVLGNILAAAVLVSPLLGPVLGLLIGVRRGLDGPTTRAWHAQRLTLADVEPTLSAFPLIARTPRAVIRAELLRRAGRLDEADVLLRTYLEQVAVGPSQALVTWAEVLRDAGRLDEAAERAAAAAILVPVDLRALETLAAVLDAQGRRGDADRIREQALATRQSFFGLVFRGERAASQPAT